MPLPAVLNPENLKYNFIVNAEKYFARPGGLRFGSKKYCKIILRFTSGGS
jgi:hypothetical protein